MGTRVNGWTTFTDTMGVYGNYYFQRAAITLIGLGANPPEDAVYPLLLADADGDKLTGEQDCLIHFDQRISQRSTRTLTGEPVFR